MLGATPLWTDVVTAVFTALTTGVLALSAILAIRQLGEAERTRYSELIATMTGRWSNRDLVRARLQMSKRQADEIRELVERMWGQTATHDDEALFYELIALVNFMEVIAVIEDRVEGLTIPAIDELWGGAILSAWDKWEPAIQVMREQDHAGQAGVGFQRLAEKVQNHRDNPEPKPVPPIIGDNYLREIR